MYECALTLVIDTVFAVLLHYYYHNIVVFNLTGNAVQWSATYDDTFIEIAFQPTNGSGNAITTLVAPVSYTPVEEQPILLQSSANLKLQTTSEVTSASGLDWVLQLQVLDANAAVIETANCIFQIPADGDNCLGTAWGTAQTPDQLVDGNYPAQLTTSSTSGDGKYKVTLSFDYLDGEHPIPDEAESAYYYQSVVVIENAS